MAKTASDLLTSYALVSVYGVDPAKAGWLFLIGLAVNATALLAYPAADRSTATRSSRGGTAAALLPLPMPGACGAEADRELYAGAALARPGLLVIGGTPPPLCLGVMLGAANLVAWALLPRPARVTGSYARFTMVNKLALGGAGLAMTAALLSACLTTGSATGATTG